MLWASASVATKAALAYAQPFVIADFRFFIAGVLMLAWAHGIRRQPLPSRAEWLPLIVYGFLNVTLYLGCFVLAMQEVSAGIGSLAPATNPLIISIFSAIWLGRSIKTNEVIGLILGLIGVGVATYPLLLQSYATLTGLAILAVSMVSYSVGTVYYSRISWQISRLTINTWQILFGGAMLLPLTWWLYQPSKNQLGSSFWISIGWLVGPVSIAAVQLWLYLLKIDTVKASIWLFLCPIFGFLYAALLLHEPITLYTVVGTGLVIVGLYFGQRKG